MKVEKNLIGFMSTTEVTVNKKDGSYNQLLMLFAIKITIPFELYKYFFN